MRLSIHFQDQVSSIVRQKWRWVKCFFEPNFGLFNCIFLLLPMILCLLFAYQRSQWGKDADSTVTSSSQQQEACIALPVGACDGFRFSFKSIRRTNAKSLSWRIIKESGHWHYYYLYGESFGLNIASFILTITVVWQKALIEFFHCTHKVIKTDLTIKYSSINWLRLSQMSLQLMKYICVYVHVV